MPGSGDMGKPVLWAKIQKDSLGDLVTNPLESQDCPESLHFVDLDFHVTDSLKWGPS